MIKTFRVAKYKNFVDTELNFGKVNIFIGPNNSGKSNFIEAMQLGAELYGPAGEENKALHAALSKRGWQSILNRKFQPDDKIELSYTLQIGAHETTASFKINISEGPKIPNGFYLTHEKIDISSIGLSSFLKKKDIPDTVITSIESHHPFPGLVEFTLRDENGNEALHDFEIDSSTTVFNQRKQLFLQNSFASFFQQYSNSQTIIQSLFSFQGWYSISAMTPKNISDIKSIEVEAITLNEDGGNLTNALSFLDQKYDFIPNVYFDLVKRIIPKVNRILPTLIGGKHLGLQVTVNNEKYDFSDLSEGAIRMFVLALLLHTPERYTVLSLDEPELNLHPAWLKLLGTWMMRGTSFDQLFISTHSPDLLDVFTEAFRDGDANIYVFDLKKDPHQLLPEQVSTFLDEGWELGDLYRIGEPRLGGWPW